MRAAENPGRFIDCADQPDNSGVQPREQIDGDATDSASPSSTQFATRHDGGEPRLVPNKRGLFDGIVTDAVYAESGRPSPRR